MMENIKDPYHPGLLHTWFVTFGLWRADQKSRMVMDEHGRPRGDDLAPQRRRRRTSTVTEGVTSFKADMALHDDRLLDVVPEPWWKVPDPGQPGHRDHAHGHHDHAVPQPDHPAAGQLAVTRHIVPRGEGEFDFVWTHFGFTDDTPEMTRRRLRQANLFGPAGFVSADDGEVIEFSQDGFRSGARTAARCANWAAPAPDGTSTWSPRP
jgi:salicylate 5-hydroxylase large subunit